MLDFLLWPLSTLRGIYAGRVSAPAKTIVETEDWVTNPSTGKGDSYGERTSQYHILQGPVDKRLPEQTYKMDETLTTMNHNANPGSNKPFVKPWRGPTAGKPAGYEQVYIWEPTNTIAGGSFSRMPTPF